MEIKERLAELRGLVPMSDEPQAANQPEPSATVEPTKPEPLELLADTPDNGVEAYDGHLIQRVSLTKEEFDEAKVFAALRRTDTSHLPASCPTSYSMSL